MPLAYWSGPEQRKIQDQKGVRGMRHPSVADHKMTNVSDPFRPLSDYPKLVVKCYERDKHSTVNSSINYGACWVLLD